MWTEAVSRRQEKGDIVSKRGAEGAGALGEEGTAAALYREGSSGAGAAALCEGRGGPAGRAAEAIVRMETQQNNGEGGANEWRL